MAGGQKIGDAYIDIDAKYNKLDKSLKNLNGKVEKSVEKTSANLSSAFAGVGAALGAAFAVNKIVDYSKEAVRLAGIAQGVSDAFSKLGDATLLKKLETATSDTVSKLELMEKSVQAVKLGIDQAQLPTYFQFATKRAQETGQSVDYLVDSIVQGVGKKSAMILDNLGISAVRLADELEKGGTYAEAVGRIISQDMADAGDVIETAAIKQAQLNKKLEDNQVLIGQKLLPLYEKISQLALNAANNIAKMLDDTSSEGKAIAEGQAIVDFVTGLYEDREAQIKSLTTRHGRDE